MATAESRAVASVILSGELKRAWQKAGDEVFETYHKLVVEMRSVLRHA